MKSMIIYKGKYGATRQYAEWLANELQVPVASTADYNESQLTGSDIVVLGSSVYVGQLQIKQWLKEHEQTLLNKKVFLFVVCGTPPEEKEKIQPYINSSVPKSMLQHTRFYFLHGRLIYNKLSRMDKFMLRMGAMFAKGAETKKSMLTDYDDVKKENLIPLVTDLRRAIEKASVAYP
jgi:menaquinone-dependent protoporphyrinogen IX oxidase